MAKYDLDLRMGLDEKLQTAELDVGALSYSIDKQNLYIDALKEDKTTVERQQIDANKTYGLKYPDGQSYMMNKLEESSLGDYAITFGHENIASGESSFAIGSLTEANGKNSISTGDNTVVNGENSLSLGQSNILEGNNSLSGGYNNLTYGNNSISFGQENKITGQNSFVQGNNSNCYGSNNILIGNGLTSHNTNALILGSYNKESNPLSNSRIIRDENGNVIDKQFASHVSNSTTGLSSKEVEIYTEYYIDENKKMQLAEDSKQTIILNEGDTLTNVYKGTINSGIIVYTDLSVSEEVWCEKFFEPIDFDDVFVIGNGTGEDNRSNAFTVNTNGDTYISGKLNVDGIVNFSSNLQVNNLIVNENITSNNLTVNEDIVSKNINVSNNITSNNLTINEDISGKNINVSNNLTVNENITSKNINVSNNITIKNDNVVTETVLEQTKTEIMTEVQQIADSIVTDVWYAGSEPPQETKLLWIRTGTKYANGILYYYTGDTTNTSNYQGWIPMSAAYS